MSFTVRKLADPKRKKIQWLKMGATLLTFARPVFGLYSDWKKRHEEEKKSRERISVLQKILLVLVALFCAALLFAGMAKAVMAVRNLSLKSVIGMTASDLVTDENGYTNFLLLGQGDESHDGVDLTDTIIIASVDAKKTKSVSLLSLPRDLYFLKTEKMGSARINSLYRDYKNYLIYEQGVEPKEASRQAVTELSKEISKIIDLPIHYIVKVDFIAFVRAVDALGGVDIEVPYDINDPEYPNKTYGYEPFIIKAGLRHLDGETALKYARSRHTTSDFARSERQQQLIQALGDKARTQGILTDPGAITEILNILKENVETTMTVREMIGGAKLGEELDKSRLITMQINDQNGLYGSGVEPGGFLYTPPREDFGGAAVLLPVSVPPFPITWKMLHAFSELYFKQRSLYLAKPQITILNAGARSGAARLLGGELIRYGFDVVKIENATIEDIPTSVISANDETRTPIAQALGTLFGIKTDVLPLTLPAEERGQITILLGEDYQYTSLQDLLSDPGT